jgi:hypothetical protein
MSLRKAAKTKAEAELLGAVEFSHPCRMSELWIIENMIKDFDRAGWAYVIVESVYKSHSSKGGTVRNWEQPALELWKIT